MTDLDLDALEALAKGASFLPWHASCIGTRRDGRVWAHRHEYGAQRNPVYRHKLLEVVSHKFDPHGYEQEGWLQVDADAAYIVAACNAVPELITRIRELEALEARVTQAWDSTRRAVQGMGNDD